MSANLRKRLADAGAHAMRQRAAQDSHVSVALEVLPVGIEVCVRTYGRESKQLLGWDTIEDAHINPIVERIDYLIATINAAPLPGRT